MRKSALPIAVALAVLGPAAAAAQVGARASASIEVNLPIVLPQLVVVSPGVQVVPAVDHEVFFVNGVYWTRHPNGWYRSKSHRGGWVLVPARGVPASLVKIGPPGKYKRWKPGKEQRGRGGDERGRGRGEGGKKQKHGKD